MAAMTGKAIREALEPFAKLAERHAAFGDDRAIRVDSGTFVTVGDLRRARTAYDAIGSGVKARPASVQAAFDIFHERPETGPHATAIFQYVLDLEYRCLSTHTAAGAEPVEPRRMAEGCCSAISPCGHQQRDPYSLCDICTRAGAGPVGEAVAWRGMASAPKDGTLLALLVRPYANDEDGAWTPFEDSRAPQPTIGFNNFDDTEEDRWQFAGWNWSQDCIVEGHGEVMGWRPFGEKLPSVTPEETVLAAIAEWGEGPCDDLEQLQRSVALALRSHAARPVEEPGEAERAEGEIAVLSSLLKIANERADRYLTNLSAALGVLDGYADPCAYTDENGDPYSSDDELHPGLRARDAAAAIRAALTGDAQEANR